MIQKLIFISAFCLFFVFGGLLFAQREGALQYQIVVNYPHDGDVVEREIDAEGRVRCNIHREGLLIVAAIKPFMHPDYWIQGADELTFKQIGQRYEASWIVHCWVGEEATRRQKFSLHLFMVTENQLDQLYALAREGLTAIPPSDFRNGFLNAPNAYLSSYGPIMIRRR